MRTDLPLLRSLLSGADKRDSYWHGERHWRAVAQAGWYLADADRSVDLDVLLLFAALHDSRRENENSDPAHGFRAAARATHLFKNGALPITSAQFEMLDLALYIHNGAHPGDLAQLDAWRASTVAACLDADRLNLWRVGKEPDPELLCTNFAKRPAVIHWARRLCAGYSGPRRGDSIRVLKWPELVQAYDALARERNLRKSRMFPSRYALGIDVSAAERGIRAAERSLRNLTTRFS